MLCAIRGDGSRTGGQGDEHKSCSEEIASPGELRRNVPSVLDRSVPISVLEADLVCEEAVFVDNMKVVAHAAD